jgi:hypothetical protein
MAEKLLVPNIPKLDMVKVPPWNSCGFNLFSLALPARSLISAEIEASPFKLAFVTIGVIRPCSVCTAQLMSTFLYCLITVSIQEELTAGTLIAARAPALIIISLTEILEGDILFNLPLKLEIRRVFIREKFIYFTFHSHIVVGNILFGETKSFCNDFPDF